MPTAERNEPSAMPSSPAVRRSRGEDAVPAPKHETDNVPMDYRRINGWGVDLDPANRPSYPKALPSDVNTIRGDVKDWQVPPHKIYVSNEHPDITPVFGTSCPPTGLSGLIRDFAFEYGEGANRHWMMLLLADRVNMWERMIADALRGRPDNYFREKGWAANFRHADSDKQKQYLAIGATLVGAVAVGLLLKRAFGARE